jgi:hypothetical protein
MDNSIYLHVSNKDSADYFPQNEPGIFRVKLKNTLNLTGSWVIGVCTINMTNVNVAGNRETGVRELHVTCNVCTGLIVDGEQTRVIRCVTLDDSIHATYGDVFYVPVEVRFLDTIEFTVITDTSTVALFGIASTDSAHAIPGTVSMTLHLKRY